MKWTSASATMAASRCLTPPAPPREDPQSPGRPRVLNLIMYVVSSGLCCSLSWREGLVVCVVAASGPVVSHVYCQSMSSALTALSVV